MSCKREPAKWVNGWVSEWVRDICVSNQSDWIYYSIIPILRTSEGKENWLKKWESSRIRGKNYIVWLAGVNTTITWLLKGVEFICGPSRIICEGANDATMDTNKLHAQQKSFDHYYYQYTRLNRTNSFKLIRKEMFNRDIAWNCHMESFCYGTIS